jgi:riboflavin biosynthesis pyrimidine reductase
LQLLSEQPGLPHGDLPAKLVELYGGPLGFGEPCTIANFVQTIDGVVAIPELERSNALIAGDSDADRFVMGLLRAFADVVLVGSATMNGSPNGTWRPDRAYPAASDAFAELRRRRGRAEAPELAVLTAGGSLDPSHPALERGALVLTTHEAAGRVRAAVPAASEVVAINQGTLVDAAAALAELHARGHSLVLSEAGPHVFTSLVERGLVDELFLTVSPLLAGRSLAPRLGLVHGRELLPGARPAELLSVRRADAHLFLRYAFRT